MASAHARFAQACEAPHRAHEYLEPSVSRHKRGCAHYCGGSGGGPGGACCAFAWSGVAGRSAPQTLHGVTVGWLTQVHVAHCQPKKGLHKGLHGVRASSRATSSTANTAVCQGQQASGLRGKFQWCMAMMIDFLLVSSAVSKKQLAMLGKPTAPALLPKLDSLHARLELPMLPELLPRLRREPWLLEDDLR